MAISYSTDGGRNWGSVDVPWTGSQQSKVNAVAARLMRGTGGPQTITNIGPVNGPGDTSGRIPIGRRQNVAAYRKAIADGLEKRNVAAATLIVAADRFGTAAQKAGARALLAEVTGGGARGAASPGASGTGDS